MSHSKLTRTVCPAKLARGTVPRWLPVSRFRVIGAAVTNIVVWRGVPPPDGSMSTENTLGSVEPG